MSGKNRDPGRCRAPERLLGRFRAPEVRRCCNQRLQATGGRLEKDLEHEIRARLAATLWPLDDLPLQVLKDMVAVLMDERRIREAVQAAGRGLCARFGMASWSVDHPRPLALRPWNRLLAGLRPTPTAVAE